MFNFEGSMSKQKVQGGMFKVQSGTIDDPILFPAPRFLLTRRATANYETRKNPKYFPNQAENDQNSRVLFEVDKLTT